MSAPVTGTVLDRILARTVQDLGERKSRVPLSELQRRIGRLPGPVDVETALKRDTVSLIAEFKRASPSKGHFEVEIEIEPDAVAAAYIAGAAAAISCLTDEPFFEGSLDDLGTIAAFASTSERPVGVLRKDFIVDLYQVVEARAYGASCILLIVAALDDATLTALSATARDLGMSTLVEVHDEPELERAMGVGATMIGINNRDLRSMRVALDVTERLAPRIPADRVVVGESGIATRSDVERLARAGVDAILVGESIILQPDREGAARKLSGVRRIPRSG
ncbi:MAG: indole-3-glycerol phosphate synthase TrpC [Chloroflexia bacterium]|nr:indole-3-glycerol phosphate synthase TrpC [Chloroflexia bacterium]